MFKLAVIGLDTSHSTVFTELIQDREKQMVEKLKVVTCMRFSTPFQSEPDQDKRQELVENLDVKVTRSFDEAVAGVDGIMIEINDPALHSFEMLITLMGRGAGYVYAREDARGIVSIVDYSDDRRGIVECNSGSCHYGGSARSKELAETYITAGSPYPYLIKALESFFIDGVIPVPMEETLEVQAMLDAAVKSLKSGKKEMVWNNLD